MLTLVPAAAALLPTSALLRPPACARRSPAPPQLGIASDAEAWITENLGPITSKRSMGGGSGWASLTRYAVEGARCDVVVKASGSRPLKSMFLGEGLGLKALRSAGSMAVPEVFAYEEGANGGSYLIMEYMAMSGRPDPETFGKRMAEMHLATPAAPEAAAGKCTKHIANKPPCPSTACLHT